MGMIEQNNITISIPSPLEIYIDHLNAADDQLVQSLWEQYPSLKQIILDAAQHSAQVNTTQECILSDRRFVSRVLDTIELHVVLITPAVPMPKASDVMASTSITR